MWINITKIVHYISTAILFIEGLNGKTVLINKDPTGQEGSNGTYIECLIDMDGILKVSEVLINAHINNTSSGIVFYKNNSTVILPEGEYLRERVTYNTISERSNRTELRFNRLLCEDDKVYQCQMLYVPDPEGPSKTVVSELSYLTVTVSSMRPNNLTIIKNSEAFSSLKNYESKLETVSFVEGDTITVTCSGNVGKPLANLTTQKIISNGTAFTLTPDDRDNNEFPNCSFFQTSTFKTTLYGEDNKAILRCAVEGFINIDYKVIETSHITVLYPVRIPDVEIFPTTSSRPPVTLHCQGFGNPDPDYTWFKHSNDSFEFYASNQSFTLYNLSDSGVYLCEVNNNIGQHSYRNSRNITVIFDVTGVIVGITITVIIVIVFVVLVVYKMRLVFREDSETNKSKKQTDSETGKSNEQLIRQSPTRQEGIILTSNYDTIDFNDDIGKKGSSKEVKNLKEEVKQLNDEYMKEHEKATIKSKMNSEKVEYAVPQKRKNKELISNTDAGVQGYEQVEEVPPERASNPYASGTGIYDHTNDRRHKKTTETQQYDTIDSIKDDIYKKQADSKLAGQYIGNEPKHDKLNLTMVLRHPNEFAYDKAVEKEANQQPIINNPLTNESADKAVNGKSENQTAPQTVKSGVFDKTAADEYLAQTTSNSKHVQTAVNDGAPQTTVNGDHVQAASYGQPVETPSNGQSVETPSNGQSVETPSNGQPIETPSNGQPVETTSNGQPVETPSNGQPVETPSNGQSVETPSNGQPIETPSNGQPVETTSNGQPVETTSKSQRVETPLNGQPVETPSNGHPVKTSSNGQPVETLSNGHPVKTSRNGHPVPNESNVKPVRTPSHCEHVQTPSHGEPVITPSYGEPVQTPSHDEAVITPSHGESVQTTSHSTPV